MNNPEVLAQNTKKNQQIDSRLVPSHTSIRNSSPKVTMSEDTCCPLHHINKSLKLDLIHRKDFTLSVIVLFFNKLLELDKVLIHLLVVVGLKINITLTPIMLTCEIERQNLQTAASNEPMGVCHSKTPVVCCICRWCSIFPKAPALLGPHH